VHIKTGLKETTQVKRKINRESQISTCETKQKIRIRISAPVK